MRRIASRPLARMKTLRSFDARDGRLGLLEWSEPVIFDRLRDAYRRRLADEEARSTLARLHCRVWRALIAGDIGKFERLRGELVVAIVHRGLKLDSLADADAQIISRTARNRHRAFPAFRARGQGLSSRADRIGRTPGRRPGGVTAGASRSRRSSAEGRSGARLERTRFVCFAHERLIFRIGCATNRHELVSFCASERRRVPFFPGSGRCSLFFEGEDVARIRCCGLPFGNARMVGAGDFRPLA